MRWQRETRFKRFEMENLRVEFLLKTDSGYPKDTGVNKPWQPLGIPSAITPIGRFDLPTIVKTPRKWQQK